MPEQERPISERFRVAAKRWVELKSAAKLADDMKQHKFAVLMEERTEMAVSRAEIAVKASKEWKDILEDCAAKEKAADLAKMECRWLEMVYGEWQSNDANARKERHMGRQAP